MIDVHPILVLKNEKSHRGARLADKCCKLKGINGGCGKRAGRI